MPGFLSVLCTFPHAAEAGCDCSNAKLNRRSCPRVLSSAGPAEVTGHFWKSKACCSKSQLNFCGYLKKGVGFLIFFSLDFLETFLVPKQASLANLLLLFPGLGTVWGVSSLYLKSCLLDFFDIKDYWVVPTSLTPKGFSVACKCPDTGDIFL